MAQIVKSTPGAIGYVDYATAKASSLVVAMIKNKDGNYVAPSSAAASAAAAGTTVAPDLTFHAVWAPGATAYPITAQSWVLVYQKQPNANDVALLKAYIGYLVGDGQQLLTSAELRTAAREHRLDGQGAAQQDHLLVSVPYCRQIRWGLSCWAQLCRQIRSVCSRERRDVGGPSRDGWVRRRPDQEAAAGRPHLPARHAGQPLLVLVILVLIAVTTSQQASSWFTTEGIGGIFSKTWNPGANKFGALPFIYGTAISSLIALVMAVPVSLGIALLLTQVCRTGGRARSCM